MRRTRAEIFLCFTWIPSKFRLKIDEIEAWKHIEWFAFDKQENYSLKTCFSSQFFFTPNLYSHDPDFSFSSKFFRVSTFWLFWWVLSVNSPAIFSHPPQVLNIDRFFHARIVENYFHKNPRKLFFLLSFSRTQKKQRNFFPPFLLCTRTFNFHAIQIFIIFGLKFSWAPLCVHSTFIAIFTTRMESEISFPEKLFQALFAFELQL